MLAIPLKEDGACSQRTTSIFQQRLLMTGAIAAGTLAIALALDHSEVSFQKRIANETNSLEVCRHLGLSMVAGRTLNYKARLPADKTYELQNLRHTSAGTMFTFVVKASNSEGVEEVAYRFRSPNPAFQITENELASLAREILRSEAMAVVAQR